MLSPPKIGIDQYMKWKLWWISLSTILTKKISELTSKIPIVSEETTDNKNDLNLNNLHYLVEMGNINEVSIGHAIIIDSLNYGFKDTVLKYLDIIRK